MTIYTFQIFGYNDEPEGISGGGYTTVNPTAQAITVSINDNDTVLNERYTTGGGVVDSNGVFSRLTTTAMVVDGVTIPIGSAVTSEYATTITNLTTGQTGVAYLIQFYDSGGYPLAQGVAFSTPISAGDTLQYNVWSNAGQFSYTSLAPLSSGPVPDGYVDGTTGNDLINGSYTDATGDKVDNNDAILPGSSGNDDYIRADAGHDTVFAGLGNDSVFGGTGNDILYGDAGNDYLAGDAGNDLVYGGAGNDLLYCGAGNDSLTGGTGSDTMSGGDDADVFFGGTGDIVTGGEGVATGADNDTLVLNYADVASITYGGGSNESGTVTFTAASGGGTLTFSEIEGINFAGVVDGTAADDYMAGGFSDSQNDQVDGSDGLNDTILGYGGQDTIVGGMGDDLVYGGTGNDQIAAISGNNTLYGDEGDDLLQSGAGTDLIYGGDGSDRAVLYTNSGNDTVVGGETGEWGLGDILACDTGTTAVTITFTGDEAGTGTVGTNVTSFSEIETVMTAGGNDTIDGSASTNGLTAIADDGDDLVTGGSGSDLVFAGAGNDTVYGGDGNDALLGDDGNDLVYGGAGSDQINGRFGDDTLWGGTGTDTLSGDDGADTLFGGAGNDTLIGGAGNDVFATADGDGADIITDFDMTLTSGKTADQLDVTQLTDAGGNPVNAWDVVVSDDGSGNALLTFPNGETLVLQGVSPAAVNSITVLCRLPKLGHQILNGANPVDYYGDAARRTAPRCILDRKAIANALDVEPVKIWSRCGSA